MPDADVVLFRRYRRCRAPADRERLVARHLPLARWLAAGYWVQSSRDDIFQVACLGLLEAIERFDPDRPTSFTSFAMPTITGYIRHYLRDKVWMIRPPRAKQELGLRAERAAERLTIALGRPPSISRVAEEVDAHADDVRDALGTIAACRTASLDSALDDAEEGMGASLGERMGSVDGGYGRVEQRVDLRGLLGVLSGRDREVLRLRFEEDLTQQEIAHRIGVSQMQVSRILRRCISTLREEAGCPAGHAAPAS